MLQILRHSVFFACLVTAICAKTNAADPPVPKPNASSPTPPGAIDLTKVETEIENHYSHAHPEIQEYIAWTARTFGPSGMWIAEDAFSDLTDESREKKIQRLATLLNEAEYGRHLCSGLAQASGFQDKRLVPGLMKVAGYHKTDQDYDCRAKWMAVAALARQQSDDAVPLLISLVDHGNQNTRNWSRAALSRQTGQDFKQDKRAWAQWWLDQGHPAIDEELLKPISK